MSSLKKFDYRIKDNRKRNIFLCGIFLIVVTIVGVKLYQSKAEFNSETEEVNLANAKTKITCTDVVKPSYNQDLTNYVNDLYESNQCPELVDDETEDNNIRYIGATPDNYVWFNDELWRIIGVMNGVEDADGNKNTQVKLIRDEALGKFSWDYKHKRVGSSRNYSSETQTGSNDWSDSQLMMMLNPVDVVQENWQNQETKKDYTIDNAGTATDGTTIFYKKVGSYYNREKGYVPNKVSPTEKFIEVEVDFSKNGLTDISKDLISIEKWYLGGVSINAGQENAYQTLTIKKYYIAERSKIVLSKRPTEWTGYIGLMYPSDYGFATSGGESKTKDECLAKELLYWNDTEYEECYKNNWLLPTNEQFLITPHVNGDSGVLSIKTDGHVGNVGFTSTPHEIYPVLYLKSNVKITSGNGTKDNPFQISL